MRNDVLQKQMAMENEDSGISRIAIRLSLICVHAGNSKTRQLKCIFIKNFKDISQPIMMTAIPKKSCTDSTLM
jgi:hypothetical protein